MGQVPSTKKEPAATGSFNSNTLTKEIFVMTQRSTRTMPAYSQRGRQFAALMAGARR
jgi:hypothetical protein